MWTHQRDGLPLVVARRDSALLQHEADGQVEVADHDGRLSDIRYDTVVHAFAPAPPLLALLACANGRLDGRLDFLDIFRLALSRPPPIMEKSAKIAARVM